MLRLLYFARTTMLEKLSSSWIIMTLGLQRRARHCRKFFERNTKRSVSILEDRGVRHRRGLGNGVARRRAASRQGLYGKWRVARDWKKVGAEEREERFLSAQADAFGGAKAKEKVGL